jgi:hypothetical protein
MPTQGERKLPRREIRPSAGFARVLNMRSEVTPWIPTFIAHFPAVDPRGSIG